MWNNNFRMQLIRFLEVNLNLISLALNQFDLKHGILLIIEYLNHLTETVLHNFMKYFSGTQINQIVNRYLKS